MLQPFILPLWGWLVMALVMAAVWAGQRRNGNAGWVDVAWTAGLGGLALAYLPLTEGWLPRRVLVAAMAALWSLRLGRHLYRRVSNEQEDGRYLALREKLGDRVQPWFFGFFQAQGFLDALLSLSFLVPMLDATPEWQWTDFAGAAVWLVSVAGEALSDRQLRQWLADPAHRGRTCRAGLWRYSRHPNYFFNWIHWFSYAVIALGVPQGWLAWIAPPLMLLLLLKVTGIPPTEEQALRSRGDDYRDYQRTTNAFFPGPPRRAEVGA